MIAGAAKCELIACVALDVPATGAFDYRIEAEHRDAVVPGAWVLVPWGRGRRIGIVAELRDRSEIPPERLRSALGPVAGAPVPDPHWIDLIRFATRYYHRQLGEVALPAIPKLLRTPPSPKARGSVFERARKRWDTIRAREADAPDTAAALAVAPHLSDAQQAAVDALCAAEGFAVHLLHGVTGSGKTEVYLRWLARVLASDPDAQVLLLVPEIALTPQLVAQVAARLPQEAIALLHSELPDGERAAHWLAAAEGRARVVVGTRLSVLTPLPRLAAVVVDEEHDPSYKQQEGVRYSARDLAIVLASQRAVPVVLGSATPSLETWLAARRGRYHVLALPERAGAGRVPTLRIVDPRRKALAHGLAPESLAAIEGALARSEQALVFLNRRGYAPVLSCEACGWLSRCDHCSAYRVLHRMRGAGGAGRAAHYRLLCHHCGADAAVPRSCPECGNVDLTPLGRGTQRLEEGLRELFPGARIGRVDRDVARRRHAVRAAIDAAHAGEVDLLIGTQMIAKGHDFQRLALVVVVDVDGGLYSADFRAPERLFALLMQVAGRAGRSGIESEVIVQTGFPAHPMFAALARHDFANHADAMLAERRDARLPPFCFQALLRAESNALDKALAFLASARAQALELIAAEPSFEPVQLFDPVPALMARVAGRERAQLLIESAARPVLHALLDAWLAALSQQRSPVRWQLDVDPLEI